jgi:hypothetical protein
MWQVRKYGDVSSLNQVGGLMLRANGTLTIKWVTIIKKDNLLELSVITHRIGLLAMPRPRLQAPAHQLRIGSDAPHAGELLTRNCQR